MKTRLLTPILAGAMAFFAVGCGTMDVTTMADADHPRDRGELVLVRVTFGHTSPRVQRHGPHDPEVAVLSPAALNLADFSP